MLPSEWDEKLVAGEHTYPEELSEVSVSSLSESSKTKVRDSIVRVMSAAHRGDRLSKRIIEEVNPISI